MENQQKLTWDDIIVMFDKANERLSKTEKMFDKADERLSKTEKMFDKTDNQLDKTEKLLDKVIRDNEKSRKAREKEMKELNQQLGGISNSNGEMAETYFYNTLKRDKTFLNEKYDDIKRNRKLVNGEHDAEFDIILFNCKSAVLIEVKYNAKPDNISVRKIISRVEAFKILFPQCKNHSIYLAVAAMTFRKGMEARLHRNGIATIRQIGKKMVVYDKEVKVF
jgi:hypothetical protein